MGLLSCIAEWRLATMKWWLHMPDMYVMNVVVNVDHTFAHALTGHTLHTCIPKVKWAWNPKDRACAHGLEELSIGLM